jgi:beta-galactosidase/beta-glucuronidase
MPSKLRGRSAKLGLIVPLLSLLIAGRVNAQLPRAEHPRPDAFRTNWLCLNGKWQFEIDDQNDGAARGLESGKNLGSEITVPFCPESKLSGVGHYGFMKHTWYRRLFEIPPAMAGKRILLHFGAVDYSATVRVNKQLVGTHIGGSVPFDFDITKDLRDEGNELAVHVFHDVASGCEPTGKQTHTVSEGCVYTRTTGIWQPVWLEAVGTTYVKDFVVSPDPDWSRVLLTVFLDGNDAGLKLTGEAYADGKRVGSDTTTVSGLEQHLIINLSEKKLWEPGAAFLYDLKLTLNRGETNVDELSSYFALRTVSIDGRSMLINGKRVFQRLILDQGFYPEGVWTAPSDAELKADIERSMAAGFNGARLHQKVFEPRYLYWADKLGYLVWGEFPNWGFNYKPENYENFTNEWREEVLRDRNHPAIIGWCPFNETPREAGELQQIIWRQTKALDPSRPIIESSGWLHTITDPEVLDDHDYNQDPVAFAKRWTDFFGANADPAKKSGDRGIPFMVSEFGGIGWATEGGWGYGNGPKSLDEFYSRYEGLTAALLGNPNLFGFCYTQLTDVEQEHNGLYYYDRRPKFDLRRLHAATARRAAYEETGPTAPTP